VIFQGRIVAPLKRSDVTNLLTVLQGWVLGKPTAVVQEVQPKFDPGSSVKVKWGETECKTILILISKILSNRFVKFLPHTN